MLASLYDTVKFYETISFITFNILFSACENHPQTTSAVPIDSLKRLVDTPNYAKQKVISNTSSLDTSYENSEEHNPYLIIGYFNLDSIADTAVLVRQKSTGKDALLIKHGGTDQTFLLKDGKSVGS